MLRLWNCEFTLFFFGWAQGTGAMCKFPFVWCRSSCWALHTECCLCHWQSGDWVAEWLNSAGSRWHPLRPATLEHMVGGHSWLIPRLWCGLGGESWCQTSPFSTIPVYYIILWLSQCQQRWADSKLTAQQISLENVEAFTLPCHFILGSGQSVSRGSDYSMRARYPRLRFKDLEVH